MNMNDVYQLMDKFESSTLSSLSIEVEGLKFSAGKGGFGPIAVQPIGAESQMPVPNTVNRRTVLGSGIVGDNEQENSTAESSVESGNVVTAPLVGTFYRAAGPGEAPFVEVGQSVKKGDVVGIIEAMKLMNEITATSDGVVEEILVEDGDMVDFGKPLIRVV